jgi:uncharacterized protein DUF6488
MRLATLLLGFILSLFTLSAMAGSDHDHGHSHTPADQATATTNATKVVVALANKNKLDKSWASIIASSVEKKVYNGTPEWVAVFVNDKITDPAKRKLFVFLTLNGEYIATNFTGN